MRRDIFAFVPVSFLFQLTPLPFFDFVCLMIVLLINNFFCAFGRYELYLPLHELWRQYMAELVADSPYAFLSYLFCFLFILL